MVLLMIMFILHVPKKQFLKKGLTSFASIFGVLVHLALQLADHGIFEVELIAGADVLEEGVDGFVSIARNSLSVFKFTIVVTIPHNLKKRDR